MESTGTHEHGRIACGYLGVDEAFQVALHQQALHQPGHRLHRCRCQSGGLHEPCHRPLEHEQADREALAVDCDFRLEVAEQEGPEDREPELLEGQPEAEPDERFGAVRHRAVEGLPRGTSK